MIGQSVIPVASLTPSLEGDSTAPTSPSDLSVKNSYVAYSKQTADMAHANGKKVVLFFHAPWCPTCKVADKEFTDRMAELPTDVVVFKTDYDSETALKSKYGITYQHTFVQIDKNGGEITKWNGGGVDEVIEKVN